LSKFQLANKGEKFFNCSLRLNQVAALAAVEKPQIFIIRTSKAFLISRQSAKTTTATNNMCVCLCVCGESANKLQVYLSCLSPFPSIFFLPAIVTFAYV